MQASQLSCQWRRTLAPTITTITPLTLTKRHHIEGISSTHPQFHRYLARLGRHRQPLRSRRKFRLNPGRDPFLSPLALPSPTTTVSCPVHTLERLKVGFRKLFRRIDCVNREAEFHPTRHASGKAALSARSVSVDAPHTANADGNGALCLPSPNRRRPRRK